MFEGLCERVSENDVYFDDNFDIEESFHDISSNVDHCEEIGTESNWIAAVCELRTNNLDGSTQKYFSLTAINIISDVLIEELVEYDCSLLLLKLDVLKVSSLIMVMLLLLIVFFSQLKLF